MVVGLAWVLQLKGSMEWANGVGPLPRTCQYLAQHRSTQLFSPTLNDPSLNLYRWRGKGCEGGGSGARHLLRGIAFLLLLPQPLLPLPLLGMLQ